MIRLGGGIFYDRFPVSQVLQTLRFNGQTQQQFVVNNPSFYPQIPSIASLEAMGAPQTIRSLAPGLRAPYLIQTSVGVEREMPLGLLVSLNYVDTRGKHLLVSRNSTITGNINYQYASAGLLNQQQFVASVRRPLHSGLTVFGRYEYSKAFSNTDGINTFPANQNNLHADYGPTATDIRNTLVVGGSLAGPLGISLNPFLVARSGAPFNITTGHDNNGDTLFTDRPAFGADPNQPGVVKTPFGIFDSTPAGGATVIPHNYSRGSGFTMLNLRLSRTFGFGEPSDGGKKDSSGKPAPALGSKWLFATPNAEYRYSFTLGIIVRNLLNITNPGTPVGSLGSPSFGRAKWLASAASPTESAFGNNRRLQFQVRFDF